MAQEGSGAGAVWVDLLIRDTLDRQIDRMLDRAGAAVQRGLADAGRQAGQAFGGGFDRGVATAQRAVARLQRQIAQLDAQMDGMAAEAARNVSDVFLDRRSRDAHIEKMLAGDKAYQKLMAQAERADRQLEAAQDRLSVAAEAAAERQATAQERAAVRAQTAAERAAGLAAAAQEQAAARAQQAVQRAATATKRAVSLPLAAAQKAAAGIAGLSARAAAGLQRGWQSAAQKAGRALSTLGRTARRVFVLGSLLAFFNGMKAALQGAVQQNDRLSASLARVKANLATAFSAVFTAALPALQALMAGLERLSARLAAFLSGLFGTALGQGKAAAKQLAAVGGSAGKAAGKLRGAALGLDELNVLQQDAPDGGAAGAGGTAGPDPGAADAGIAGFGEQLRAAILAQDWDGLGRLLGEQVNCLVDGFDAAAWGARLGRLLQAGIATAWRFLETVDWAEAGRRVGEFCSMALAQIDAWKLGQLLVAPWTIGFGMLQGAIETLDWALLGRSISNGLLGALQQLTEAVQGVDWALLGSGIAQCIRNIDWIELSEALGELLGSAARGMLDFLGGLLAEPLEAVKALFLEGWNEVMANDELYEDAGAAVIAGLLNGIWKVVAGIGKWIYTNLFTPFMDGFKEAFGIHSPSTVMAGMGQYLVQGLLNGITGLWGRVTGFFSGSLDGIRGLFSDAWEAVARSTRTIWGGIRDTIKGAVNGVIGLINGLAQAAANGVNAVTGCLNRLRFAVPDWVPGLGGKTFGFDLPRVTAPQIPLLAEGGYVGPNQPQLAIIGDNRREGEIVAPESKIAEAVAAGLARRGGAGDPERLELLDLLAQILEAVLRLADKDARLLLDGEVLARAVQSWQEGRGVRTGGVFAEAY